MAAAAGSRLSLADEFAVESRTIDTIRVRHLRYDHRYIFTVKRIGGRRILWSGPMFGNAKASVPPRPCLAQLAPSPSARPGRRG